MKMFYTKNNGKIEQVADFKFSDNCLETEREIFRAWDGEFYFKGEEPEKPSAAPEVLNAARIAELQAYLNETDWYAIRQSETSVVVPADIAAKRQEAREEISKLRGDTE